MEPVAETNPVYIALDFEVAGPRLSCHSTLSVGAALVTRTPRNFSRYVVDGDVFYAELKPISLEADVDAMRVGCSQLRCLEAKGRTDPRYNVTHAQFDPRAVLELLEHEGEEPEVVIKNFRHWIDEVAAGRPIIGVTDTVFFDGGHAHYNFGQYHPGPSPFGYAGLDLTSMYRGMVRRADACLSELDVPAPAKLHRADHDAVFLAERARIVLYDILGWS